MQKFKAFLKRKDIEFSLKRYFIDALGAMAQGLFASLLIGTIISTIGQQFGIDVLVEVGNFAKGAQGAAMAVAIGYALKASPLVLFSLTSVGVAANQLGGAGGAFAVLIITIIAQTTFIMSQRSALPADSTCGYLYSPHYQLTSANTI